MKNPQYSFWKDKKVLVTGHTGFKGGWLTLWLKRMGAKVQGIGLPPNTNPNLFLSARIWDNIDNHFCDIRDKSALKKSVHKFAPEVVFHLAGQALVKVGYREPIETLEVNVMGTAYLLQILREVRSAKVLIMVTSDKVYSTSYSNPLSNTVRCHPYRETDPLGGIDPYSASKAASEMVITSYAKSFLSPLGIAVASVRAGNVLGGGDWAPNRLIPDAIRSWINKRPLIIRNPKAVRPWQHVLDPLAGYLLLAETLWTNPNVAGAFNFGPPSQDPVSVRQVVEMAKKAYGEAVVIYSRSYTGPYEDPWLTLDATKANKILGFTSRWSLSEVISRTISWYKAFYAGIDPAKLCESDITAYEEKSYESVQDHRSAPCWAKAN